MGKTGVARFVGSRNRFIATREARRGENWLTDANVVRHTLRNGSAELTARMTAGRRTRAYRAETAAAAAIASRRIHDGSCKQSLDEVASRLPSKFTTPTDRSYHVRV